MESVTSEVHSVYDDVTYFEVSRLLKAQKCKYLANEKKFLLQVKSLFIIHQ